MSDEQPSGIQETFISHLIELRTRLVRASAVVLAVFVVLFMASEQLFWKNFCEGVGRMDLFERWPGSKYADHARGNRELQAELREIFKTRTSAEWIAWSGEPTRGPFFSSRVSGERRGTPVTLQYAPWQIFTSSKHRGT